MGTRLTIDGRQQCETRWAQLIQLMTIQGQAEFVPLRFEHDNRCSQRVAIRT
jgi:hypothetical protein